MLHQQLSGPLNSFETTCFAVRSSIRARHLQQAPYKQSCLSQRLAAVASCSSSTSASYSIGSISNPIQCRREGTYTKKWSRHKDEALPRPARRRQTTAAAAGRSSTTAERWLQHTAAPTPAPKVAADAGLAEQAPLLTLAAATGASQQRHHVVRQPHSHLVMCEAQFSTRHRVRIPRQLVTDLAELHSEGSCPVQVSVVVHPLHWDDTLDCRTYILQQHPNAAPQQHHSDGSNSHGPYAAILKQCARGQPEITALAHDGELKLYRQPRSPHTLVLQERVPSAGGAPHFRLHIQPGSPAQPNNNYSHFISRAGEGKGLQVFPGSVTEVTAEAGKVNIRTKRHHWEYVSLTIPRVLLCSQLPASVKFPLGITVRVWEQRPGAPDRHVGQLGGMTLYWGVGGTTDIVFWEYGVWRMPHPLSAYKGRRIAKMSLMPHQGSYRLTLTLAPPAAADTGVI